MSRKMTERESRRLRRVATEYRNMGYDVSVHPDPGVLPMALQELHPDLVAISGDDRVIVEVKSRHSLGADLSQLARVAEEAGWRFELVLSNPTAGKKKARFSKASIEALAQDKPVVYKIRNRNGTITYAGVAKKGRVADRLKEHLPGGPDPIPGAASVEIRQMSSIAEARDAEARSIKRSQPRHNKVGK